MKKFNYYIDIKDLSLKLQSLWGNIGALLPLI